MEKDRLPFPVKRPLFAAGVTAVAATAVALECVWWLSLLIVGTLAGVFFCRRRLLCAMVALLCLCLSLAYRYVLLLPVENLDRHSVTFTGVVVEEPTTGKTYTVRITASDRLPKGAYVRLYNDGDVSAIKNDILTVQAQVYALQENQLYDASQGVVCYAFPNGDAAECIEVTGQVKTPLSALALQGRQALSQPVRRYLPSQESQVLTAMCFGQREHLHPAIKDTYRHSSMNHLLVVSGLHLSLVALTIRRLLRPCGKRTADGLTLVAVWLFALLVGSSPSVLRASIMCTVWLVGKCLFCRADGLNSLGLAATLLVVAQPYVLWNAGFQLSFAATAGVLMLAPRLCLPYEPSRAPSLLRAMGRWAGRTLRNGGVVCMAALLFTLPIAAYHYGGISLTSIVANIVAVPAAGAALATGWLGAVCSLTPLLGWLGKGLLLVAGLLTRYLNGVAALFSPDRAWITIAGPWQWWLLLTLCLLTVTALLLRISLRRRVAALGALMVLTLSVGVPLTATPQLTVVSSDNHGGFVLRQGAYCALILTHLQELTEVAYNTAPFQPQVVVVMEGSAGHADALRRWPHAVTLAATEDTWAHGSIYDVAPCPVGATATLWEGCRVTVLSPQWLLVQVDGHSLCIGTDPHHPCPLTDVWSIYVGGCPEVPPRDSYTVVCSPAWLRRHRPALTGRETLIVEQDLTFTPHQGEWRTVPWI